ncbi:DUF1800 domain-containing protein [Dyadobacter frigoris]|uniref:DUF1800 domain-containing protein n=1 Tax=Dyadobacter frigoris TaxID=2576211 RepID=A0A4U6CMW3_9BACT|nr:DUF1800 domain-containing protein [Dyadobacter frigoris]TKT84875.1 DUF1800 domain-containing protein [Dyadobacter frigoris]GLU57389.1 hypothetical protein Dfri01_68500 [Dyadobacter frigoris]
MMGPSMTNSATVEEDLKIKQQIIRENLKNLNATWFRKMVDGESALRERMSLFWHGHFACRVQNPQAVQSYLETLRKHALGNFGEMLLTVSKEPAMLQFLNNQQNRKKSPNENFAREVMELFTMGRGNYSEQDVKEAARAFTGWVSNPTGIFQFRPELHDDGVKRVLGRDGNFAGEDVIRILLEKKETALFVTGKIYKSFVSEIPDKARINKLADGFYKSGYDISKLLRNILESDWFYDSGPQTLLIKSPVELMVGMQRALGAVYADHEPVLFIQKVLGQILFSPPSVAGWPGGRSWIDSSSLLFRMQLPGMLAGAGESKVKAKDTGDANDIAANREKRNSGAVIDWHKWACRFGEIETAELPVFLAGLLLAVAPSTETMDTLPDPETAGNDRVQFIRKLTLSILGLPEYQVA